MRIVNGGDLASDSSETRIVSRAIQLTLTQYRGRKERQHAKSQTRCGVLRFTPSQKKLRSPRISPRLDIAGEFVVVAKASCSCHFCIGVIAPSARAPTVAIRCRRLFWDAHRGSPHSLASTTPESQQKSDRADMQHLGQDLEIKPHARNAGGASVRDTSSILNVF